MVNRSPRSLITSMLAGVFTCSAMVGLLLISASLAQATPGIDSVDPSRIAPEETLWINGHDFPDRDHAGLCWGIAHNPRISGTIGGRASYIAAWTATRIQLSLPETMTAGSSYWFGICRGRELLSPQSDPVTVTGIATAPVVTGYNPSHATPGGNVHVYGRRFGTRRSAMRVRFGTSLRPVGDVEVLNWGDTEIQVRLPADMRSGTYWLAIYRGAEQLSRGLNKGLRVRRLEEITLHPMRLGTTLVNRLDRNNDVYCGLDRRGFGGPADWDATQVSIGGITAYNPGTPPLACWEWRHSSYQGAVLFDLSPLIAADRPLPAHVELRLRQDGGEAVSPCGTVYVFDALADWSPDLAVVSSHPRGTMIGGAGRVDDRLSLPITEHVRNLINVARGPEAARRRYYGFLLNDDRVQRDPTAEDSRRLNITSSPSGCVAQYRDFELFVRWER